MEEEIITDVETARDGTQPVVSGIIETKEEPISLNGDIDVIDINTVQVPTVKPADSSTGDSESNLEIGTIIEFDGVNYTINATGDLIDDKGIIFKSANDVNEFIKNSEIVNGDADTSDIITAIQKELDIEVTDEKGEPIVFENTPEGIVSYVTSVIETKANDIQQAAINSLFEAYPDAEKLIKYISLNGSADGFAEIKDRRGISIETGNVSQCETVIRESFKEFGRKGDVESYIKYLKDSGTIEEVASEELKALQILDGDRESKLEADKSIKETAELEALQSYWNGVKDCIYSKNIAGYKIPDIITINKGGKSYTRTPDDFFNYLYKVDSNGISQYEKENSEVKDSDKVNDELLRAYLRFTGGSYADLVNMAIKEKEVKKLIVQRHKTSTSPIRIIKPNKSNNIDDILLD